MPGRTPSGPSFESSVPGGARARIALGRRHEDRRSRLSELLPGRADFEAMRRHPRRDVVAGLSVAVVALPLALAYGASSGLGARAGLATAVVAGALAAIFGGGALQVSGPTGAMTVVLIPVVHRFGPGGVMLAGAMAGVVLIAAALARVGRFARCVPAAVVEGFAVGVAVVIALQQVPAALGLRAHHHDKVWRDAVRAVADYTHEVRPAPLLMAAAVAAVVMTGNRWLPKVPFPLVAIGVATLVAEVFPLGLRRIGSVPAGLPAPSLGFLHPDLVAALLPSALAIAVLAALEGLLSAAVVDAMGGDRPSDPDRELFGQGLSNLAVPLVGGVPATATLARTAVNVRCGATSRLASLTHAVVLAVIAFAAGGLVADIPRAALAGLMFGAAVRMIKVGALASILRTSRVDTLIVAFTCTVTVAVNLIAAVAAGVVIATLVTIATLARGSRIEAVPFPTDGAGTPGDAPPGEISLYRLDGPWFFATTHRLLASFTNLTGPGVVILNMTGVSALDLTAARVIGEVIAFLRSRGVTVLLAGVRPDHHRLLAGAADARPPLVELIHPDPDAAITHARSLLAGADPRTA
ncbi:SulP family inorganic anion transporter [Actinoallomurus soli]|uniref:SulP family inorganic anion transporter n=1 Tax=Actinoallomurus soli TaxID=2952535 RepID=UPI002093764A|nr:SulP family inorganic anion transporter [Actinoallomurus soli]MCO5972656.1 SulP family inorganic anion transporter [Actinoallomurus soli]